MCEEQDALVFLPVERWSELQSAFKSDWPRGLSGFEALELQRQWKERGIYNSKNFKVYCPYGDVRNGMVAFNEKIGYYEIIIFCPSADTEKLADALKTTKLIDWNREVIVPFAPRNVLDCLDRIIPELGLEVTDIKRMETLVLEKGTFEDVSLPPNITFGLVPEEYVDLIDSTWPRRYPGSSTYFRMLINSKSAYGLFHNNTLICWVLFREIGLLQHLYTVEEHRGKGYAEMLLKLAGNIWMSRGRPMFGYCYKDNTSACKLYKKLGFVQTQSVAWYFLNKKVK